jgi:hypothetical protein
MLSPLPALGVSWAPIRAVALAIPLALAILCAGLVLLLALPLDRSRRVYALATARYFVEFAAIVTGHAHLERVAKGSTDA